MSELFEGAHAIAEAGVRSGVRFYAGYPITPSTEILEYMSWRLPQAGGVCMNAESELEAIGMVWGAAATGARAMIASTGQGISLMQESFAEMAVARIPFLAVNMARGQGDYFQATRGGGHGDYRHIVLAPASVQESADHVALGFRLAERYRIPALIMGDFLLGHTIEAVTFTELPPREQQDWTTTGAAGRASRNLTMLGTGGKEFATEKALRTAVERHEEIASTEARAQAIDCDGANTVAVAFGMPSRFVRAAAKEQGIGFFRPITLWPFPAGQLRAACKDATTVKVFEVNNGQMLDDVRLALNGSCDVQFVGGISTDRSGFGVGDILDTSEIGVRLCNV